MLLSKDEAKVLIEKILSKSKADSASVSLYGSNSDNLRFALNTVSTCGAVDSINADITSSFGKKSGSVTFTPFDDAMIENGVRKSEEIAKLSPDIEEFMPPLEKQSGYLEVEEFFDDTNNISPEEISDKILYTLNESSKNNLQASGYFENASGFYSTGNTNNLFAYHKNTYAQFASTVRTNDGKGSSKIDKSYANINLLNINKFTDKVIDRAILSQNPVEYPPGKYVTVLDHAAVSDMVERLLGFMSLRSADEGRSFFSKKGGGNKIGESFVDSKVNIFSDPQNDDAPSRPFSRDGFPLEKTNWIAQGTLNNLYTNRYWAKKMNTRYIPYPTNLIMSGTNKSVEDLIAETEKGIFVTRLWYIRTVDSKQILLTGLTRDGVFLIEDGKLKHPVKNFRFNESPVNILQNITEMSVSEKAVGSETGEFRIVVPALKLSEFNFSTISDAT